MPSVTTVTLDRNFCVNCINCTFWSNLLTAFTPVGGGINIIGSKPNLFYKSQYFHLFGICILRSPSLIYSLNFFFHSPIRCIRTTPIWSTAIRKGFEEEALSKSWLDPPSYNLVDLAGGKCVNSTCNNQCKHRHRRNVTSHHFFDNSNFHH